MFSKVMGFMSLTSPWQAWTDVRIAAPSPDHFAIEFLVALKCFEFGIGKIPIEVYVLENGEPARAQIAIKRCDSAEWVLEMREQEPGINNVEARANALVRGSNVEQSELRVANSLRIRFAAGDVELRLIDVRANGFAARANSSSKLQGDITTTASTAAPR